MDDENYQKGIEEKKKVYAENGIRVAWIYPDDVWEEKDGKYQKKPDEEIRETILSKIYDVMQAENKGVYKNNKFETGSVGYGAGNQYYAGA